MPRNAKAFNKPLSNENRGSGSGICCHKRFPVV